MSDTRFTPGPWRAGLPAAGFRFAQTGDWLVTSSDGLIVAMAIHDKPPEAEPNAHLIAAAPELYAVVRAVFGNDGFFQVDEKIAASARAALAKAEGRS